MADDDSAALRAEHRRENGLPASFDPLRRYAYVVKDGELVMVPLGLRPRRPVSFRRLSI